MKEDEYNILDIRNINEFKNKTFSGYQISDVKNELINNIYNNKIENAFYWSSELICIGAFLELWNIIIYYYCKYIHIGNPKLPIYLCMRFNNFKEILNNGYSNNELLLRNNSIIRKLYAEVIISLALSKKKHSIEFIKINNDNFIIANIKNKIKATSINFADNIFLKDDPKDIFIAINEFNYHLSDKSNNIIQACYWFEWIINYEIFLKGKKENLICERRLYDNINDKDQKDVIWIIWDSILLVAEKKNPIILKIIKSLLNLFTIKYTKSYKKKRKLLIYIAITFILEDINLKINIIENKEYVESFVSSINLIYKDIKKNEILPKTDYLFKNLKNNNIEKSIQKMELLNNIDIIN